MEIQVKLTVELGEATKAFITSLAGGVAAAPVKESKKVEAVKEKETPAEEKETAGRSRRGATEEKAETGASRRRSSTAAAAPKKEVDFKDLDEEAQLTAILDIQALIAKKKGGSVDIKEMLGVFDAGKAQELEPADYVEYHKGLVRYRAGESVDDIYPQQD